MIDTALRGDLKFRVRVYWTVHQPYCDFLRLMGKANFAADVPAKAALRAENPKQGEWNGTDKKDGQSGPYEGIGNSDGDNHPCAFVETGVHGDG